MMIETFIPNMEIMEYKLLKISMRMALFMGIFLPLAETLRRSNQLLDPARFINWFDDYLLGGARGRHLRRRPLPANGRSSFSPQPRSHL